MVRVMSAPGFSSDQDALTGNWNGNLIRDCDGPGGMVQRCKQPATFWFNPVSPPPRCPAHMDAVFYVDSLMINQPANGTF